jgi:hypothetical protein
VFGVKCPTVCTIAPGVIFLGGIAKYGRWTGVDLFQ